MLNLVQIDQMSDVGFLRLYCKARRSFVPHPGRKECFKSKVQQVAV